MTMNKILAFLATTIAATTLIGAPANAGFLFKQQPKEIQVASVDNSQLGWMAVLSDDGTPVKKAKDINTSPIGRKLIAFDPSVTPGTIIIDNSDRRLYHVISKGVAMVFGVSVGRDGFRWTGTEKVSAKTEWPTWNPPEEMRVREAKKGHMLPETMEGGLQNPLGARAMYLGSTEFRIHGTNQPDSIGKAMSSGCIRMANEDVEYLYSQVKIGTTVIVRD
jgi:lipoprotein-anchoring transpeptidase ErfK/SrfK